MIPELNDFYLQKHEPIKSCLMALRDHILNHDPEMTEAYKYRMPCFCYKGKAFCYLWTDKKTGEPYILMVEGRNIDHPALVQGDRARMKILPIDPNEDLPLDTIEDVFELAKELF
ncbi:MAG: DUF1801 domain-containing protein [Bacteroidota bacterium]